MVMAERAAAIVGRVRFVENTRWCLKRRVDVVAVGTPAPTHHGVQGRIDAGPRPGVSVLTKPPPRI
jgi:hypothetical protein